jgi:hypothetical protein
MSGTKTRMSKIHSLIDEIRQDVEMCLLRGRDLHQRG